jgi:hypothetical protein
MVGVRALFLAVAVVTALSTGAIAAIDPEPPAQTADPSACIGSMKEPANGTTLISVQGAKGRDKKPARVVAVGPEGSIEWVHHSGRDDTVDAGSVVWSYDVDPLPSGEIFVTVTIPGDTVLYAFDPRTGEVTWQIHRPDLDTHDADVLPNGNIAVANMRNYDEGENRDRVYVLDPERNRTVWQWRFSEFFGPDSGGEYTDDWTHVNDVDRVGRDRFLLSPRNLDQVVLLDRSSEEVVWRLGRDGEHSTLKQQHNPDYLRGPDGQDTVLVADSENDRIVEYARRPTGAHGAEAGSGDASWNLTWRLSGDFQWPRDADRLPSGNTLVTDSRNHRVLEVAPNGTVVWEVYTPWLPYDAERLRTGDGSGGPTARGQGAPRTATVAGGDGGHADDDRLAKCAAAYRNAPDPGAVDWTPKPSTHTESADPHTRSGQPVAGTPRPPGAGARASPTTATDASWPLLATLIAVGVSCAVLAMPRRAEEGD